MASPSRKLLLVVAALSAGCSLLKFNVSTPETRRKEEEQRQAQAQAEQQRAADEAKVAAAREAELAAAREQAIVAEIEALRAQLTSAPSNEKAQGFAEKVAAAEGTPAARDGRLDVAKLRIEALGYLERAITAEPNYAAFLVLAQAPGGPEADATVARVCPGVRPKVRAEQLAEFMDTCLARVGGEAKKYKWASLKADLVVARKAAEARAKAEALAAREAEKAEKEAEKDAEKAGTSGVFALAGVFAAGRCEFGDCLKNGWTIATANGDVRVRCNFGNCLKDGWNAELPGGGTARTRCNFGDCMKDGWDTELPGGGTARTRCNFGNCGKDGWDTQMPDGGTARARCNFGDCFKDGWDTQMPDGSTVRCKCNFGKCLTDGTSCD